MDASDPLVQRWILLNQVHYSVLTAVDRHLMAHLGLNYREYRSLELLEVRGRNSSAGHWMRGISAGVGLSQSATSRLIGRLAERGFISKRTASRDGRSFDVRLTATARAVLERGTSVLADAVHRAVSDLPPYGRQAMFTCDLSGPQARVPVHGDDGAYGALDRDHSAEGLGSRK
ncbi:MarR family winged helix-turn-helix transcriptional regulator [Streptomyces sp. NPDC093516]|uniref:MarR family winged helix-turn-helix transcriptional regulator n=1 Tax=Streptomyces sp. NPDC093516 TaxID=3155304 RepID=UPI0034186AF3